MVFIAMIIAVNFVNKNYRWYHNLEITMRSLLFPFFYALLFWVAISNTLLIHYMASLDLNFSLLAGKTIGLINVVIVNGIVIIGILNFFSYKKRVRQISNEYTLSNYRKNVRK